MYFNQVALDDLHEWTKGSVEVGPRGHGSFHIAKGVVVTGNWELPSEVGEKLQIVIDTEVYGEPDELDAGDSLESVDKFTDLAKVLDAYVYCEMNSTEYRPEYSVENLFFDYC